MLFVDRRHDKSSAMNTVGRRSALLSLLHAAGLVAWARLQTGMALALAYEEGFVWMAMVSGDHGKRRCGGGKRERFSRASNFQRTEPKRTTRRHQR
jgi:hypothetical protein